MAASSTEICNNALFEIGDDPIQSLSETSKRARTCATVYPQKRRAMLMRYRWTFAKARAALMPDVATPAFGFTYQFQLPADCLAVIGLGDDRESLRNYTSSTEIYKIEGRKLLYTDSAVNIFYIKNVEDTSLFDPLFEEALVFDIAHRLCYALSTGLGRVGYIERSLKDAIKRARLANAIQETPEMITADEFLSARYSDIGDEGDFRIGPIAT